MNQVFNFLNFLSDFAQFILKSTNLYLNLINDFCTSLDFFNRHFRNKSGSEACYDLVSSFLVNDGSSAAGEDGVSVDPKHRQLSDKVQAYYQNVRGLRTKVSEYYLATTSCTYGVIALTETSLNPSTYNGELFDSSEFFVYRCDRSTLNSDSDLGGGVLIAVRSHISSELVTVPGTEGVEMVVVRLEFERSNIFVCCVYIPFGSDVSTYRLYYDALEKVLSFLDLDSADELWILICLMSTGSLSLFPVAEAMVSALLMRMF